MNKLSDNLEKHNLLGELVSHFKTGLGLTPCVGAEIEFYLSPGVDIALLEEIVRHSIKPEKGNNQYEIDLGPSENIQEYVKYIQEIRKRVILGAKKLGGIADFSSKPFIDDYGNSMHIHLNFLEDNDVDKFARILCHYLSEDLSVFLPSDKDRKRLDERFMAPTRICYGGNNRTVAIRIPDSLPKRIEHRVSAANADPASVIYVILNSIAKGLNQPESIPEYRRIYGNAFDPQYELVKI
jgi:glutamine synthetase